MAHGPGHSDVAYQEDSFHLDASDPCPWRDGEWICRAISRDGDKGWLLTWGKVHLFALRSTYQEDKQQLKVLAVVSTGVSIFQVY